MRNIHLIPFNLMLNITEHWLNDESFTQTLEQAGPLGVGLRQTLTDAHEPLAQLKRQRAEAQAAIRTLIDEAARLDLRHDRFARAMYLGLQALTDAASSEQEASNYRELESLLFPEGLRVINLSHAEEGGAAIALRQTIRPELRAKLAAIPLGSRTLDELLEDWLVAGAQLGKVVAQRAELRASLGKSGTAAQGLDLRVARTRWLNAVRGLLWAIDSDAAFEPLRERVNGVLRAAVQGLGAKPSPSALDPSEELDGDAPELLDEDEAPAMLEVPSEDEDTDETEAIAS